MLLDALEHSNSFFGHSAGSANTSGAGNSFFGTNAGTAVTTGGSNTYIGTNAGLTANTGSLNTILGVSAGSGLTIGGSNTILGYNAGSNVTTGSNNIFIGKGVTGTSTSATNQLNIGQILFGDLSTGNVGIASTSPWRKLSVTGTVGFDGLTGSTGAGSLCLDSNKQVVYNSASDNCLSSTRATKHDSLDLDLDSLSLVDHSNPPHLSITRAMEECATALSPKTRQAWTRTLRHTMHQAPSPASMTAPSLPSSSAA